MLLVSLWATVGRVVRFFQARRHSRAFVAKAAPLLRDGKLAEAASIAAQHRLGHIARVALAGLDYLVRVPASMEKAEALAYLGRGMARSVARTNAELNRGLDALATLAATAPFVGTYGTIVGILHSFRGVCMQRATVVAMMHFDLAAALAITALSLLVAVPTTWVLHYFAAQMESFDIEMNATLLEMMTLFALRLAQQKEDPSSAGSG